MDIDGKIFCARCMREMETEGVCPQCGYDANHGVRNRAALEQGTLLNGRYQLGAVIGQGGFGITYAAWDEILGMPVAVKEYFPADFCSRDTEMTDEVVPLESKRAAYLDGLRRFQRESHLLAELQGIPSVVKVLDFFPENGTTYIAMEYIHGVPLDEWVREKKLGTKDILKLMRPVVDALVQTHRQGVLHRDLTPGNMLVREDGTVKLIDFGSAAELERSGGTVVLTRKYAAVEQYGREHGAQGPWTDVYGIAAVMYALLTGTEPQESVLRVYNDELKSTRKCGISLKKEQHTAIMNALAVDPGKRTQSMEEFRARLYRLPMPQEIIRHMRTMRRIGIAAAVLLLLAAAVLANYTVGLPLSKGLLLGLRGDGWHIMKATGAEAEQALPESVLGIPVTTVDSGAFRGNETIRSVSIPGNIHTIGDMAFYDCSELRNITLADGVECAGVASFSECPNLTEALLPESLCDISAEAFNGSTEKLLIWGQRGGNIEVYATDNHMRFADGNEMDFEPVEGGLILTRLESVAENLVIPSYVNGEPVIAVAEGIRISNAVILELPEHLNRVPEYLCQNNKSLTILRIGPEVQAIDRGAFMGCTELTDFLWPAALETIGSFAFEECQGFRNVSLPEHLREIGFRAFGRCQKVETILIPDSLRKIGGECFSGTLALQEIQLPDGLEEIPASAFSSSGVKTVRIPDSVTRLGDFAFSSSQIEYLLIPETVTYIGQRCFSRCEQLQWLEFLNDKVSIKDGFRQTLWLCNPDLIIGGRSGSVAEEEAAQNGFRFEKIDEWTDGLGLWGSTAACRSDNTDLGTVIRVPWFNQKYNCPIIRTFSFHNLQNVETIILSGFQTEIYDGEFFQMKKLKKIIVNNVIQTIHSIAFDECTSLEEISFPDGLKSIGMSAFSGCVNLSRINLPDTVNRMEGGIFEHCKKLTEFRLPAGMQELGILTLSDSGIKILFIPSTMIDVGLGLYMMPDLETVIMENGVQALSKISQCPKLKEVVLPPSMEDVTYDAFKECKGLKDIWIYNPELGTRFEEYLPSSIVLHGYALSTTESFAKEHGYHFKAIQGTFDDREYMNTDDE